MKARLQNPDMSPVWIGTDQFSGWLVVQKKAQVTQVLGAYYRCVLVPESHYKQVKYIGQYSILYIYPESQRL